MKPNHLLNAAAVLALMTAPAFAQTAAPEASKPAAAKMAPQTAPGASVAGQEAPVAQPSSAAQATTTAAAPAAQVVASGDIVQTAQASGQFTTFLKAAEATNLTTLLKTQKNITVFAPTDAAFAALPAGELDKLMLPENKPQLQKLLIYHLVNAPVKSADFKGSTRTAATVAGPSIELQGGEKLMVNDATIVQADVTASNGVLHIVDKVLSPSSAPTAVASAPAATETGTAAATTAPAPTTTEAPAEPAAEAAPTPTPKS